MIKTTFYWRQSDSNQIQKLSTIKLSNYLIKLHTKNSNNNIFLIYNKFLLLMYKIYFLKLNIYIFYTYIILFL